MRYLKIPGHDTDPWSNWNTNSLRDSWYQADTDSFTWNLHVDDSNAAKNSVLPEAKVPDILEHLRELEENSIMEANDIDAPVSNLGIGRRLKYEGPAWELDAVVQCSLPELPGTGCERLEDFLDMEVSGSSVFCSENHPDPGPDAVVESVRCALEKQNARLNALHSEKSLELATVWESRLERVMAGMDAERAETQKKFSLLHDVIKERMMKKGRGG